MYEEAKAVIIGGDYELVDMLSKIDTLWIEGALSDEERDELKELARENADPEASNPEMAERMAKAEAALRDLEARVSTLENDGQKPEETVPEYDPYTVYQKGMKCRFEGKVYEWVHVNPGNWSPKDYPAAWKTSE